ncbi:MAG TPA: GNAT family N-acetyltransferase [Caulobacteraceae bacterium]|nr:GNAT family N-acetyltransferase [Caulobacteraceae bacterium]
MSQGDLAILSIEDPAGPEARNCLARYFAELSERFEGGFDPEADASASAPEMSAPNGRFVVGRQGGGAIACGGLKRAGPDFGEVKRVWVAPEARGQGLSRRIMALLEDEARAMGLRRLRLDTNQVLHEAQSLYLSLGYRAVERFNDNPWAHCFFERDL